MSEEFKKAESLVDQLKEYVNTRVAQLKLSAAEKASRLAASMIAVLVAALVFLLFLALVSVAAAIVIGQWLGSMWLGFLVLAGVVLVITFLLWTLRDRLLRIPIMNSMLKVLFEKEEDDEKN